MKNLLLTTTMVLTLAFPGTVLAQQQDDSDHPRCAPFSALSKKLEENGFSPVFLGERDKAVYLAILQKKEGDWVALRFIKAQDGTVVACIATAGDQGSSVSLDAKPPSESP